jgi:hypothetical protein
MEKEIALVCFIMGISHGYWDAHFDAITGPCAPFEGFFPRLPEEHHDAYVAGFDLGFQESQPQAPTCPKIIA